MIWMTLVMLDVSLTPDPSQGAEADRAHAHQLGPNLGARLGPHDDRQLRPAPGLAGQPPGADGPPAELAQRVGVALLLAPLVTAGGPIRDSRQSRSFMPSGAGSAPSMPSMPSAWSKSRSRRFWCWR